MLESKERKTVRVPYIQIVFFIILLVLVGIGGYYLSFGSPSDSSENSLQQEQELVVPEGYSQEDAQVLADLKIVFDVPQDEVPLMAVVTDVDLVKEQEPDFFKDAKLGDRVLVYPTMTILFDPILKQVLNAGQVDVISESDGPVGVVTFAVYNGSGKAGAAASYSEKIKVAFSNVEITVGNAPEKVEQTTVYDVLGKNPEMGKISEKLGAVIGDTLPANLDIPEKTMVVVIVGKDYEP